MTFGSIGPFRQNEQESAMFAELMRLTGFTDPWDLVKLGLGKVADHYDRPGCLDCWQIQYTPALRGIVEQERRVRDRGRGR